MSPKKGQPLHSPLPCPQYPSTEPPMPPRSRRNPRSPPATSQPHRAEEEVPPPRIIPLLSYPDNLLGLLVLGYSLSLIVLATYQSTPTTTHSGPSANSRTPGTSAEQPSTASGPHRSSQTQSER